MLSTPQNSPYPQRIATALAALRRRIAAAAEASGRTADAVTLLAVGKGHPVEALAAGAVEFIAQEVEMDPRPADAYFGFAPRPLAEGLREYIV